MNAQRNIAWTFSNILRRKPYNNLKYDDWETSFRALKHYLLGNELEAKSNLTEPNVI